MKKWNGKLAPTKPEIADRGTVRLGSSCITAVLPARK